MPKTQIQVLELWNNAKKGLDDVEKNANAVFERGERICDRNQHEMPHFLICRVLAAGSASSW